MLSIGVEIGSEACPDLDLREVFDAADFSLGRRPLADPAFFSVMFGSLGAISGWLQMSLRLMRRLK